LLDRFPTLVSGCCRPCWALADTFAALEVVADTVAALGVAADKFAALEVAADKFAASEVAADTVAALDTVALEERQQEVPRNLERQQEVLRNLGPCLHTQEAHPTASLFHPLLEHGSWSLSVLCYILRKHNILEIE